MLVRKNLMDQREGGQSMLRNNHRYPWLILLFLLTLVFSACDLSTGTGNSPSPGSTSTAKEPDWGVQTKTTGCQAQNGLPDSACTPGAIFPEATKEKICVSGYSKSVRHVTTSTKNKVYAAYGIKKRLPGQYEVDHLVSLQLGGSNEVANLWPEIDKPKPGFHEKDRVENYLHDQVCDGKMTLRQAQIQIATDWKAVYSKLPSSANNPSDDGDGS
jgi:hypothetical protein